MISFKPQASACPKRSLREQWYFDGVTHTHTHNSQHLAMLIIDLSHALSGLCCRGWSVRPQKRGDRGELNAGIDLKTLMESWRDAILQPVMVPVVADRPRATPKRALPFVFISSPLLLQSDEMGISTAVSFMLIIIRTTYLLYFYFKIIVSLSFKIPS